MPVTLLIDGDVPCHTHAYSNAKEFDFGSGSCQHIDADKARSDADDELARYAELLKADRVVVCLSDERNWRYRVLPTYKHNRDGKERPELHAVIRAHLMDAYDYRIMPRLEGDDVMGILATDPARPLGTTIIVSIDKDMQTIPGLLFRPHKDTSKPIRMTPEAADRYHLFQTLIGDGTDGYSGCPGVGPTKAGELLEAPVETYPEEWVVSRGKNKGEVRTRWLTRPTDDVWRCIVSHYEKAGLTEADALVQARVARICRHQDWDSARQKVLLWTPDKSST